MTSQGIDTSIMPFDTPSEEKVESSTINSLLIFSSLLIIYNALFSIFAFMLYWAESLPGLIIFVPIIAFF